jgi:hypothetical protein
MLENPLVLPGGGVRQKKKNKTKKRREKKKRKRKKVNFLFRCLRNGGSPTPSGPCERHKNKTKVYFGGICFIAIVPTTHAT